MKRMIIVASVLIVVLAGIIIYHNHNVQQARQQQIAEYTKALSGTTYEGAATNKTVSHGTAVYRYIIDFDEDAACKVTFKYSKSDDKSIFSSNKLDKLIFEDLSWKVQYRDDDESGYYVYIGGTSWDWEEYTAAELNHSFIISEEQDSGEIELEGCREKYHSVYFYKATD